MASSVPIAVWRELPVLEREHDVLIEDGDAEPAEQTAGFAGVSHSIRGPADMTEVLEVFDPRYRDVRGEDDPYSLQDPDYPQCPPTALTHPQPTAVPPDNPDPRRLTRVACTSKELAWIQS